MYARLKYIQCTNSGPRESAKEGLAQIELDSFLRNVSNGVFSRSRVVN